MSLLLDVLKQSETESQSSLTLEAISVDDHMDDLIGLSSDSNPSDPQHDKAGLDAIQSDLSTQYTAEIAALAIAKSRTNALIWLIEMALVVIVCTGLYEYYSLNQAALVVPVIETQAEVQPVIETDNVQPKSLQSEAPLETIITAESVDNQPTTPVIVPTVIIKPEPIKTIQYSVAIQVSVGAASDAQAFEQPKSISDYQSRIDTGTASADDFAQLGLLHAQQLSWHEMQSAYSEAVKRAPERADYHFNLAISLERIKQPEAAVKHYQVAMNDPTHHAVAQQRINAIRNQK